MKQIIDALNNLAGRVRAGSEAAPWVAEEIQRIAALAAAREQQPVAYLNVKYGTIHKAAEIAATDRNRAAMQTGELLPLYAAPPVPDAEAAALWRDLVSHQKFNNQPQVGFAINQAIKRVAARGSGK